MEEEIVQPAEHRFLSACVWLRERPVLAFIAGLFTLGVPYAMAGIGGADPDDSRPPLIEVWSRGKLRLVAAAVLSIGVYQVGSTFLSRVGENLIWLLALPFAVIVLVAMVDLGVALFTGSDSFALTRKQTFDEPRAEVKGPSALFDLLLQKVPEDVSKVLGLAWAWTLGLSIVVAFVAGVALSVSIGLILIGVFIALWILNLFLGNKDEDDGVIPPRDTIPWLPPIPFDKCELLDRNGTCVGKRVKGQIYRDRAVVGRVVGETLQVFGNPSRTPHDMYRVRNGQIISLFEGFAGGTFDEGYVTLEDGEVLTLRRL